MNPPLETLIGENQGMPIFNAESLIEMDHRLGRSQEAGEYSPTEEVESARTQDRLRGTPHSRTGQGCFG